MILKILIVLVLALGVGVLSVGIANAQVLDDRRSTVTAGADSATVGYVISGLGASKGSIVGETFTNPSGTSVTTTQVTRAISGVFSTTVVRYSISGSAFTANAPDYLRLSNGSNVGVFGPKPSSQNFGSGSGGDYPHVSGSAISDIIINGEEFVIEYFYGNTAPSETIDSTTDDTTLSALSVSGASLSPSFNRNVYSYLSLIHI